MTALGGFLSRNPEVVVIDVGADAAHWRNLVVRFGGIAAILSVMGVNDHLCVDVRAYVDGEPARASAFGMDNGAKYRAFGTDAPGRSHGLPAVSLVSVLIGAQRRTNGAPEMTEAEQALVAILDYVAMVDNDPNVVEITTADIRCRVPAGLTARLEPYRTEADA